MNEYKICFIICSNNEEYLTECFHYLQCLEIPSGYEVDTLVITEAVSMAAGYNEGMKASDAKYKIYMHHDVFIRNRKFLNDILSIFSSDVSIGMIGMIGAEKLPDDGVMFRDWRVGNIYRLALMLEQKELNIKLLKEGCQKVEVIDGLMMITQYDIPWREDVADGWDFYDVTQCLEFRRAGYQIVVPGQQEAWYIHDCEIPSFWNYEEARQKAVKAYPEFLGKTKRIYYPHSDLIKNNDIPWALLEMGYDVSVGMEGVLIQDYDEQEKDRFVEELKSGNYDYVITFNLSPVVAQACLEENVPYIAWAYDSPLKETYGSFAKYPTNHVFVMDRIQLKRLGKQEIPHLHYFPLATNMTRVQGLIIEEEDEKQYGGDISFVGSLYYNKLVDTTLEGAPQSVQEDVAAFIEGAIGNWSGESVIYDRLSEQSVSYLMEKNKLDAWKSYGMDNRFFYETILTREITFRERVMVLSELAKEHNVCLYTTNDKIDFPDRVKVMPKIDYETITPKVFHLSKINLNITLRSIESGAPQRIFDIMGVGGFVLSNYQAELAELFVPDKEIVLFRTIEELKEKANYYLTHEKERITIAMAGYQKVKECYSYTKVLGDIMEVVNQDLEQVQGS